ncbi:MAG TPA: hypothetical protein VIL99_09375, partial [Ignavibacteria bacterium]
MAKTPLFGLEIPMLYIGTLAKITLKIFYVITQSKLWKPALIFMLVFYFALSFPNVFIGNPVLFQRFSLHFSLDFEFSHSLCQSGEGPCENKKITPSFTTGMAKTPRIWVGNPDALYRDFSQNYFKDILCYHT